MNSRDYRVLSDKNVETFILRGFTIIMLFECIVTLINTIIQWSHYGLVGRSCFCEFQLQIFLRIVSVFLFAVIVAHILFPWVLCQIFVRLARVPPIQRNLSYFTILSVLCIVYCVVSGCLGVGRDCQMHSLNMFGVVPACM